MDRVYRVGGLAGCACGVSSGASSVHIPLIVFNSLFICRRYIASHVLGSSAASIGLAQSECDARNTVVIIRKDNVQQRQLTVSSVIARTRRDRQVCFVLEAVFCLVFVLLGCELRRSSNLVHNRWPEPNTANINLCSLGHTTPSNQQATRHSPSPLD